jgi:hypothetical protein
LGSHVVYPAVFEPFTGIGGEVFIGVYSGLNSIRDAGTPDAEGADADSYPGFLLFHGGVELADEGIDDGAALGWGFAVVETEVAGRIGVEVVVEVDAVDVVAADYI